MKGKYIFIYSLILLNVSQVFFSSCEKDDNNSTFKIETDTVTDIDGNTYKTIKIGTQWWMAENLKTTKYNNGDLIGTTNPINLNISWETTPKYQWAYDGDESNVATYGRIYTWYVLTDSRGVCPSGWHVPTDAEWTILTNYLGGESIAGGKLKEKGTLHWQSPNSGATNESGFTALPCGIRQHSSFVDLGYYGYWWSISENAGDYTWSRGLGYYYKYIDVNFGFTKSIGQYVRCVKN